jgi:hypothetical protein
VEYPKMNKCDECIRGADIIYADDEYPCVNLVKDNYPCLVTFSYCPQCGESTKYNKENGNDNIG